MLHYFDAIFELLAYPLSGDGDMLESLGEVLREQALLSAGTILGFFLCLSEVSEKSLQMDGLGCCLLDGHHLRFAHTQRC